MLTCPNCGSDLEYEELKESADEHSLNLNCWCCSFFWTFNVEKEINVHRDEMDEIYEAYETISGEGEEA